jgi:SAM-dependent methyltransferase
MDNQYIYEGGELELFSSAVNWKNYFSKKLKKYVKGDILEVGAGIGSNFPYFQNGDVKSYTLLEPDIELFRKINIVHKDFSFDIKLINSFSSEIKDVLYDCIIYIDVLEHIEYPHEELVGVLNLLKPNGFILILVPAYGFLYNNFDKQVGHFRRYNKQMLRNQMPESMVEQELYYLDSVSLFASVFNKFFAKKNLPTKRDVRFWDFVLIRISRLFDILFFKAFGKSLIGVYRRL